MSQETLADVANWILFVGLGPGVCAVACLAHGIDRIIHKMRGTRCSHRWS